MAEPLTHCPCEGHLQAALTDGCRCEDHVHTLATNVGAARAAAPSGETDRPFVVRVFEGQSWVPLKEAAEQHATIEEAGVTIAGLRNALLLARESLTTELLDAVAALISDDSLARHADRRARAIARLREAYNAVVR